MQTTVRRKNATVPISKEKIKELIPIMDVARKYSPKVSERTKLPLIICPFHEDHNLGSCRVYPATNTFKCEACGSHGDMLKLASGYLDTPLSRMNELLEKLTAEFGITRESAQTEYKVKGFKPAKPPDRLSPEEYKELLMDDHYKVPYRFEEFEYPDGQIDYIPVEYSHIYYRTLAVKDPEFHDWVICTVSRKYWLRFAEMELICQENGYELFDQVLREKMDAGLKLLFKGLINKNVFRKELKLRNELLRDTIEERKLSA